MKAARLLSLGAKALLTSFEEALAPGACVVCDRRLLHGERHLCGPCYANLPPSPSCDEIYQKFINNFSADNIAVSRASGLIAVDEERAALKIVHALKYEGRRSIVSRFAEAFAARLIRDGFTGYDAIIPLPLHPAKKRERGYNQAYLISDSIAEPLGSRSNEKIIYRKRYTQTQTALNAAERKNNIEGVFECRGNAAGGKFLVVDDVMTTGSTINSAALALLNAGAASVDAAALVIA